MKTSLHRAPLLSGTILLLTAATLPLQAQLKTYTFGPVGNQFTMDFVTIGNPGNLPDTTGPMWGGDFVGSVPRVYEMGKYEVSEDMINRVNALGNLGITIDTRGANKPATSVSWNEAARFVNWLNTSLGYSPAYNFAIQPGEAGYDANANIALWALGNPGYDPTNPYRNSLAHFFLPSENEWYKAAYYDGVAGVYYNYPTWSDGPPTAVAGGTGAWTAVFYQARDQGPADIANAGGLSPYGTMGQGGNVREYLESASDGVNDSGSEYRLKRGGDWYTGAEDLLCTAWYSGETDHEHFSFGFRVAAVPEPVASAGVIGVAALGFALRRRRGSL